MRLEIIATETLSKINELFRKKVQFEEQLSETKTKVSFQKGVIASISKAQDEIKKIFAEKEEQEKHLMPFLHMATGALNTLNELCKIQIQKQEEVEENEVNLHFHRGILFATQGAQKEVMEIRRGQEIENRGIPSFAHQLQEQENALKAYATNCSEKPVSIPGETLIA